MDSQAAFQGYEEGPILFRPTYRYNIGTDTYDTSEKMRIPAWTGALTVSYLAFVSVLLESFNLMEPRIDRILYRGNDLDLTAYSRAELLGSDHRPGSSNGLVCAER